jgi:hypothetical protein
MRNVILCLLFVAACIAVAIWSDNRHRKDCEAKGGVYYSWRGAHLCLKPGATIP